MTCGRVAQVHSSEIHLVRNAPDVSSRHGSHSLCDKGDAPPGFSRAASRKAAALQSTLPRAEWATASASASALVHDRLPAVGRVPSATPPGAEVRSIGDIPGSHAAIPHAIPFDDEVRAPVGEGSPRWVSRTRRAAAGPHLGAVADARHPSMRRVACTSAAAESGDAVIGRRSRASAEAPDA